MDLTLENSDVWFALQLNRKIRQGILNRSVRTERIISRCTSLLYELQIKVTYLALLFLAGWECVLWFISRLSSPKGDPKVSYRQLKYSF